MEYLILGTLELTRNGITRWPDWQATLGMAAGILLIVSSSARGLELLNVIEVDFVEQHQPVLPAEYFDGYVYARFGGAQEGPVRARKEFRQKADAAINRVDRLCGLHESQKQKLDLAARGDIHRLFDRVELTRARFDRQRLSGVAQNTLLLDLRKAQTILTISPVEGKSLFQKCLRVTLTPEQLQKYLAADRDERRAKSLPYLQSIVRSMELSRGNQRVGGLAFAPVQPVNNGTPQENPGQLDEQQRQRVIEMLQKEITLPIDINTSGYAQILMRYQCSRIPEEKWKSVLNEKQWAAWSVRLQVFSRYKSTLEQRGLLPDEDESVAEAGAGGRR